MIERGMHNTLTQQIFKAAPKTGSRYEAPGLDQAFGDGSATALENSQRQRAGEGLLQSQLQFLPLSA
jgi:hypothetical protein